MKVRLRQAKNSGHRQNWLLEWQLEGTATWYRINERRVIPHDSLRRDQEKVKAYREAMNRLNNGETVEVEAGYDRKVRRLIITEVIQK